MATGMLKRDTSPKKKNHSFYVSVFVSSHRRRLMSIDTGRARFLVDKLNLSQALVQRQQGRQLLSASFLRWESFFEVFRKTSGLPTDVKIDFLAK